MNEHISSDRLIGLHRSREDYTQSPANTLQFAYNNHRYVKMTYELLHEEDELKSKILVQLVEDFSLADNVDQALLVSDLLSVLLKHLKNKNTHIRLLSTTIIKKVCASALGRKTIITRNCIEEYEHLINDDQVHIRTQVYDGLIEFAEFTEGINCILATKSILNHLVDKLLEEKQADILLKTVTLLKILMQGETGTPLALKSEIISRLMSLASHSSKKIQFNVFLTLANISFNYQGKQAIVVKGYIKTITPYLQHQDQLVREASCLLLCSLAQLNQGKIEILQFCQIQTIETLLNDSPPTVLNAVQLLANLAENPIGRIQAANLISKENILIKLYRSLNGSHD